jgi:FKBP-type peptidyl-prolyl cis-trans isomerase FkpA
MKRAFLAFGIVVTLAACSEESLPVYSEQLAKDVSIIDSYLSNNSITAEKDPLGFRFTVLDAGSSFVPAIEDSVAIISSTKILNGLEINRNVSGTFLLSKLIKAFQVQLPRMGEGAKVTLYVPSGLAYGAYPAGSIPANSNLIVDIQLRKVIPEFQKQLLKDVVAIDNYLKANSIVARKDISNLRYVITTAAASSANAPLNTDSVVINYTGKILSTGSVFYQSSIPEGYRLNKTGTLKAWQRALTSFKQGTKATLYVPSGFAYGSYEKFGVPPNTNVFFEVELFKVISK